MPSPPRYDLLNTVLSGGTDRYWRWRAVRALGLTGRETVDRPLHRHRRSRVALARPGRARRVVGLDFAGAMLRVGLDKVRRAVRGVPASLARGDAMRLPVADGLRRRADHRLRHPQRRAPGRRLPRVPARAQARRPARHPRVRHAADARIPPVLPVVFHATCCRASAASCRITRTPTPTCRPRSGRGPRPTQFCATLSRGRLFRGARRPVDLRRRLSLHGLRGVREAPVSARPAKPGGFCCGNCARPVT